MDYQPVDRPSAFDVYLSNNASPLPLQPTAKSTLVFDLRNPVHAGLIKDLSSRIACEVEREGDVIGGQNVAIMKLTPSRI